MVTFYLVRHGQKEKFIGDPPLNEVGKKQARHTAKFLKNKHIQRIYASPFKRTTETADFISKELGLEVGFDDRLRERMNWGDKENEAFEEFIKEWQKTDLDRDYQPYHGFSSRESGRRLESFLNEISKNIQKGSVLIVAHGGIIGDLLRNVFLEKDLPFVVNEISKAKYIEILECSVTIIKKDKELILEKIGDISHLPIPLV